MIDALGIADKLSTLSLASIAIVILAGSYFKIWCWYSVVTELQAANKLREDEMKATYETALTDIQADYEKRLLKYEASNNKWETMALRGVGLAEVGIGLVKKADA